MSNMKHVKATSHGQTVEGYIHERDLDSSGNLKWSSVLYTTAEQDVELLALYKAADWDLEVIEPKLSEAPVGTVIRFEGEYVTWTKFGPRRGDWISSGGMITAQSGAVVNALDKGVLYDKKVIVEAGGF